MRWLFEFNFIVGIKWPRATWHSLNLETKWTESARELQMSFIQINCEAGAFSSTPIRIASK